MSFKKQTYYENTKLIFTPNGVVPIGTMMISEKWEEVLVYEIWDGFGLMFRKQSKRQYVSYLKKLKK